MLNCLAVFMFLSEKVLLDKVSNHYLFHPKCRLSVQEETRLKYDSREVQDFSNSLSEFVLPTLRMFRVQPSPRRTPSSPPSVS